jgi:phosphoglycolate phosphatase-like HAD superfamily hydrolase
VPFGAVELVHRLHRRGVALAVVISARRVGAEAKLAAPGLLGYFSTWSSPRTWPGESPIPRAIDLPAAGSA